ncbi:hypothetical protein [uncultured Kordia sp.]|uniref:tetratricopeptide repeat protein n=1 Tax=uncultured Kordia sp. TaxID=507699 RepID=UPI00262561C2|nr:hypothetical protein [uncultured Kordia sp.]
MMEDDILIERYLKGTLSEQEEIDFLSRLNTDTSFKEQVQLEQQMFTVLGDTYWSFASNHTHEKVEAYKKMLESEETSTLKSTISNANETYKKTPQNQSNQPESKRSILHTKLILRIAAVLIIFISILWFYSNDKVDYKAIATKAWNKNIGLDFTVRNGTSNSTKVSLANALQFYNNKKYEQVIASLKKYTTTSSHYKDILVIRAVTHYKLGKTSIALKTLDSLKTYAPDIAKWYKGLIHLENNELDKASQYIQIPTKSNQDIKLK